MKSMDTYSLLPENEYTEVENRRYLVPTLGVTQTNDFIDNLRSNQRTQNAQINQQTQNLGTKIPSVMGGLTGGTGYWTSRYQTPQTNMAAASLRAASQADALKTALANEKAYWQKRYQEAYRAQQKSAYDKSQAAAATASTGLEEGEDPIYESTSSTIETEPLVGMAGKASVVDPYTGVVTDVDMVTGKATQRGITYWPLPNSVARTVGNRRAQGVDDDKEYWRITYTLPSGKVVPVDYATQSLVLGSDGNYYIRRKKDGTTVLVGR